MLTPQQIKEIEEFIEKLNNSAITGHISGRHLILVGGKQDREWTGGDYEESEYRFLDEYIKSFIITIINNLLAERDNNTLIKHIDSEIERLENIIPPYPADKENPLKHAYQNQGYMQATQDTVKSLKAQLTKSK